METRTSFSNLEIGKLYRPKLEVDGKPMLAWPYGGGFGILIDYSHNFGDDRPHWAEPKIRGWATFLVGDAIWKVCRRYESEPWSIYLELAAAE